MLGCAAWLDSGGLGQGVSWAGLLWFLLGSAVPCRVQGELGAARKRSVLLAGVSTEVLTAGSFEPPAGARVFITRLTGHRL